MAWYKKKPDPISDRARALNAEIAALEDRIKRLDSQRQNNPAHPRLRSTALPRGENATNGTAAPVRPAAPAPRQDPIFESVEQHPLESNGGDSANSAHYNELGVRKYDLPALWNRIRHHFRGPSTSNPRLINYLAAGGIQGLRPLRYEKRVMRNRLILLVTVIFVVLFGVYWVVFVAGKR